MASISMGLVMIFSYGRAIAEFIATVLVILACIKYLKTKLLSKPNSSLSNRQGRTSIRESPV